MKNIVFIVNSVKFWQERTWFWVQRFILQEIFGVLTKWLLGFEKLCNSFSENVLQRLWNTVVVEKPFLTNRVDGPPFLHTCRFLESYSDWWEKQTFLCLYSSPPPDSASYDLSSEGGRDGGWRREEKRREEKRREEKRREEGHHKGDWRAWKSGGGWENNDGTMWSINFSLLFFPYFFYNKKSVHHYHSQPLNAAMKQINNQFVPEYTKAKPYTRYINTDMHAQVRAHTAHSKFEPGTIGMVCFGLPEPL